MDGSDLLLSGRPRFVSICHGSTHCRAVTASAYHARPQNGTSRVRERIPHPVIRSRPGAGGRYTAAPGRRTRWAAPRLLLSSRGAPSGGRVREAEALAHASRGSELTRARAVPARSIARARARAPRAHWVAAMCSRSWAGNACRVGRGAWGYAGEPPTAEPGAGRAGRITGLDVERNRFMVRSLGLATDTPHKGKARARARGHPKNPRNTKTIRKIGAAHANQGREPNSSSVGVRADPGVGRDPSPIRSSSARAASRLASFLEGPSPRAGRSPGTSTSAR